MLYLKIHHSCRGKWNERIIETNGLLLSQFNFSYRTANRMLWQKHQEKEYGESLISSTSEAVLVDSIRHSNRWRWILDQQSLQHNTKQNILTQTEQQCMHPQPSIPSCSSTYAWHNQPPFGMPRNDQEYCIKFRIYTYH